MKKLEMNLKRADYYAEDGDDYFTLWSLAEYDTSRKGIHLSYDKTKKKITAYHEDGVERKNFLVPINYIFTGKIFEKNGKTGIKGIISMAPIFNIIVLLVFIGIAGLYAYLTKQRANIAIIAAIFVIFFILVKKSYRNNMDYIAVFLDSVTYSPNKSKKNSPNKKKGKWAGRHY
jgi:hypothetical protein